MRVLTNAGSNLPAALLRAYDIAVVPQSIVVDDVEHDTRTGTGFVEVDEWVKTAKEFPYVRGSSSTDFVQMYRTLAEKDRDLVAVMSSKHLIGTFTAATSAARSVNERKAYADLRVHVVDSGSTDMATGLLAVYLAMAARAGMDGERAVQLADAFTKDSVTCFAPDMLDYLVKGGRAGFVRAWLANMLSIRPILKLEEGEIRASGQINRKDDFAAKLVDVAEKALGRGRPVWSSVVHADDRKSADRVADELRRRFDVRYVIVQPISTSIYLHVGPKAVGLTVHALDKLPWQPDTPPAPTLFSGSWPAIT